MMFPFPKIPMSKIQNQARNITKKVPLLRIGRNRPIKIHIHCIVLVHGWMGNSKELSYLQSQLIQEGDTASAASTGTTDKLPLTYFLTYPSIVNEGRTSDGISNGGQRLAYEINTWMQTLRQQIHDDDNSHDCQYHLSLSLIGNSLGGLYARYALRDVHLQFPAHSPHSPSPTGASLLLPLHFAVFATTCTPHLGVGGDQAYIPFLPSWIQSMIARCIGPTGYDLFRIVRPNTITNATSTVGTDFSSDWVQEMAFRAEFMQPLQSFHRRIALCNTYRTDLQVPCSTASFLISPTTSELGYSDETLSHRMNNGDYYSLSEWNDEIRHGASIHKSCISLIVETTATTATKLVGQQTTGSSNEIAAQLDSLGWMKIFCDTRPYLPSIPIGTNVITTLVHFVVHTIVQFYEIIVSCWPTKNEITTKLTNPEEETTMTTTQISRTTSDALLTGTLSLNTKEHFSANEIWNRYILDTGSTVNREQQHRHQYRWYLPFGHTVVVANAKNEWYGRLNAAGRPTMDQFAKLVVQEILQSHGEK